MSHPGPQRRRILHIHKLYSTLLTNKISFLTRRDFHSNYLHNLHNFSNTAMFLGWKELICIHLTIISIFFFHYWKSYTYLLLYNEICRQFHSSHKDSTIYHFLIYCATFPLPPAIGDYYIWILNILNTYIFFVRPLCLSFGTWDQFQV